MSRFLICVHKIYFPNFFFFFTLFDFYAKLTQAFRHKIAERRVPSTLPSARKCWAQEYSGNLKKGLSLPKKIPEKRQKQHPALFSVVGGIKGCVQSYRKFCTKGSAVRCQFSHVWSSALCPSEKFFTSMKMFFRVRGGQ